MTEHPLFKIRSDASQELIKLLDGTTLGTNGAMYRHLDTPERIKNADNPLFLSLERNGKILGNITFCQRGNTWYIRYFAFNSLFQSGNGTKRKGGNSTLKNELANFFDAVFAGNYSAVPVESMYAYIEPQNERSKWMSEQFGFQVSGKIITQSFSRFYPKDSNRVKQTADWSIVQPLVEKTYGNHRYYFPVHAQKPPFYYLEDEKGQLLACLKVTRVQWEIKRLPGKQGALLTKLVPYVPFLRKLIKPAHHTFLAAEVVCYDQTKPKLIQELLNAVLFREQENLILWWVDERDPVWLNCRDNVKWGFFTRLIGVPKVDLVERFSAETCQPVGDQPFFVTAFDLI